MTNRDDGFFYYTITLTEQMKNSIVTQAKAEHLQRLRKYQNKIRASEVVNTTEKEYTEPIKTTATINTNTEETTWVCPICRSRNLSSSNKCWCCDNVKEKQDKTQFVE